MFETLERLILLQIGAAAATRERVQETVNRLVEQGRLEREEGRTVVAEVLRRAQERSEGTRSLIDTSVQQGLRGAGLPNREAYEDLLFRVEQLEHRVRLLEDQPVPSAEEPVLPEEGLPANGADVAPPRDEPGTSPGLQPGG
jgi:polyhydroxyalkanoate synthesis regulator phasin